jgi:hypothetical protein
MRRSTERSAQERVRSAQEEQGSDRFIYVGDRSDAKSKEVPKGSSPLADKTSNALKSDQAAFYGMSEKNYIELSPVAQSIARARYLNTGERKKV